MTAFEELAKAVRQVACLCDSMAYVKLMTLLRAAEVEHAALVLAARQDP